MIGSWRANAFTISTAEARTYPVVHHRNAEAQKAVVEVAGTVPLVCIDGEHFIIMESADGLVRTPLHLG